MSTSPEVHGLSVATLGADTAQVIVNTVVGRSDRCDGWAGAADNGPWQVVAEQAHGYDVATVTDGTWVFASKTAGFGDDFGLPKPCTEDELVHICVFGGHGEVVVARAGGGWQAWLRRPKPPEEVEGTAHLMPAPVALLIDPEGGARRTTRNGFTKVAKPSGQFAVIPFAAPAADAAKAIYFDTTEWFTADPVTGVVRVAAITATGYRAG